MRPLVRRTRPIARRTVLVGGRRHIRRRRRQTGRGIRETLGKLHGFVESKRLVSSGLRHFGYNRLANHAHMAGYGARRRRPAPRRRRRQRGTGFFGDLWGGIKKGFNFVKDNKLVSRGLALIPHPGAQRIGAVAGQLGFGGRRRRMRGGCNSCQRGGAGRIYGGILV